MSAKILMVISCSEGLRLSSSHNAKNHNSTNNTSSTNKSTTNTYTSTKNRKRKVRNIGLGYIWLGQAARYCWNNV